MNIRNLKVNKPYQNMAHLKKKEEENTTNIRNFNSTTDVCENCFWFELFGNRDYYIFLSFK